MQLCCMVSLKHKHAHPLLVYSNAKPFPRVHGAYGLEPVILCQGSCRLWQCETKPFLSVMLQLSLSRTQSFYVIYWVNLVYAQFCDHVLAGAQRIYYQRMAQPIGPPYIGQLQTIKHFGLARWFRCQLGDECSNEGQHEYYIAADLEGYYYYYQNYCAGL